MSALGRKRTYPQVLILYPVIVRVLYIELKDSFIPLHTEYQIG